MSLINEALKRAKQLQEPGASAAGLDMRPAGAMHQSEHRTGHWMPVLIGVVFTISVILLWQWFHAGPAVQVRAKTPAAEPGGQAAAMDASVPAQPQPAAAVPADSATPAEPVVEAAPTVAAAAAPEPATTNLAVIEPAVPPPVTYKLQSLFYRPKDPSAVINGKTVFVGDRVGEARVVAIARDAVTIVTLSGQTNLLELP